jgi:hypothetical protein
MDRTAVTFLGQCRVGWYDFYCELTRLLVPLYSCDEDAQIWSTMRVGQEVDCVDVSKYERAFAVSW